MKIRTLVNSFRSFHLPPVRLSLSLLSSSGREMILFDYSTECSCSQATHQLGGYRVLAIFSQKLFKMLFNGRTFAKEYIKSTFAS